MKKIVSLLVLLTAPVALADDHGSDGSRFYAGASIGGYEIYSEVGDDNAQFESGDIGYSAHAGMVLNDWLDIEARIASFAQSKGNSLGYAEPKLKIDAWVYGVYARPKYAFNDNVDVYALVGMAIYDITGEQNKTSEVSASNPEGLVSRESDDSEISYGVGIEYFPEGGRLGARGDLLYIDDMDNYLISGGVTYRF
ncbi:MAG: hypothetical protein CMD77_07450 [Gammaproteobacteria bacterium]|jgi:opacity protein-like surface antigen|nr:hypothetical protein [Gammaproteobacteria bacterium]|tara:strand:- start:855 stop:1442 length:588 start_codon:yes stop_codon:yes gene_type:complete